MNVRYDPTFLISIINHLLIILIKIRGELVMSKENFARINEARKASGDKLFKNARNLVSGMLHLDLSDHVEEEGEEGEVEVEGKGEVEGRGEEAGSVEGEDGAKVEESGEDEAIKHEGEHATEEREGEEKEGEESKHEEEPKIEAKSLGDIVKGSLDFMAYTLVLPPGI